MKKTCIILSTILIISLTGCSSKNNIDQKEDKPVSKSSQESNLDISKEVKEKVKKLDINQKMDKAEKAGEASDKALEKNDTIKEKLITINDKLDSAKNIEDNLSQKIQSINNKVNNATNIINNIK